MPLTQPRRKICFLLAVKKGSLFCQQDGCKNNYVHVAEKKFGKQEGSENEVKKNMRKHAFVYFLKYDDFAFVLRAIQISRT